mmetsp:Transcript_14780/g.28446  ORF Transcript_14780/g.28446 Transcript_14780/m.28446 type:complete len:202 (+) Transcript_14780:1343-1948(+)
MRAAHAHLDHALANHGVASHASKQPHHQVAHAESEGFPVRVAGGLGHLVHQVLGHQLLDQSHSRERQRRGRNLAEGFAVERGQVVGLVPEQLGQFAVHLADVPDGAGLESSRANHSPLKRCGHENANQGARDVLQPLQLDHGENEHGQHHNHHLDQHEPADVDVHPGFAVGEDVDHGQQPARAALVTNHLLPRLQHLLLEA